MAELKFPSDLGTHQQGHLMKIKIFPSDGAKLPGEYNANEYKDTISLFIPGGNQNGPLQWQMIHEYDDVKLARVGANALGAITKLVPGGDQISGAAGKFGGAALGGARLMGLGTINPKVDVLYGNSEMRRFQFDFFLAPESEEDNQEMRQIVKTLRMHSAPRLTSPSYLAEQIPGIGQYFGAIPAPNILNGASGQGSQLKSGLWFIPPAEFEIDFMRFTSNRLEINTKIPKIGRCVLERIDVNYTQQGEFSTFIDGSPTNLQLTTVFREMRIISQADIDNGY